MIISLIFISFIDYNLGLLLFLRLIQLVILLVFCNYSPGIYSAFFVCLLIHTSA